VLLDAGNFLLCLQISRARFPCFTYCVVANFSVIQSTLMSPVAICLHSRVHCARSTCACVFLLSRRLSLCCFATLFLLFQKSITWCTGTCKSQASCTLPSPSRMSRSFPSQWWRRRQEATSRRALWWRSCRRACSSWRWSSGSMTMAPSALGLTMRTFRS